MLVNIIDPYIAVLFSAYICYICYCLYKNSWQYWAWKGLPFLKPLPIVGNVINLLLLKEPFGDILSFIHKKSTEKLVGFYFLVTPYLLVRDPEIIKTIFVKDFGYFRNRMFSHSLTINKVNDPISVEALCVLDYPKWKNSRNTLSTAFSTSKLKSSFVSMGQVGRRMNDYIEKSLAVQSGAVMNAKDIATKFTTDLLVHFIYGLDAKSFQEEETPFRQVSDAFFYLNLNRAVQFASGFFYPNLSKLCGFSILGKSSTIFLRDVFKEAIALRIKNNCNRNDLLDYFIQLQRSSKEFLLGDESLAGQAASFFLAGNETTSATISFALHELSLNIDIQDTLRAEIRSVLNKSMDNVTFEKTNEMKYLDMVVCETLRKYPPLSFLDRRSSENYTIPEANLRIDKGTGVFVSLLGLHHDPRYFPNPGKFNPERFSAENISKFKTYTYMPLGCGPHSCIAGRFGVLAVKVALINILWKFQVNECQMTNRSIKFDPKCPTLIPIGGLPMEFKILEV